MAINPYIPATFTGNGVQVDFTFTFPYLDTLHVKATINGVAETGFTFFSSNVLRFTVAPANGAAVEILRETPSTTLYTIIQPGGPLPVDGLNNNFLQSLYYNQETQFDAASQSTAGLQAQIDTANANASTALTVANSANATALGLAGSIATANANADAAVITAGTANTNATNAVNTANTASTNATNAVNAVASSVGRNKIMNGRMWIAQRGLTFTAMANGYCLDRWQVNKAGAAVYTVTFEATGPNNNLRESLKLDMTTADASIAAGDFTYISQVIEGNLVRDLIGSPFTLSFWVKSPKTGTHCISLRNSGIDRSYIVEYAVAAANTWEFKSVTVSGGLITAGTWDWNVGRGLEVGWCLAAGTTFRTTANAWQTGNFLGTSNQVNCLDNVANDFFLSGVQLEAGSVATAFESIPYDVDVLRCQRYFWRGTPFGAANFPSHAINSVQSWAVTYPTPLRVAGVLTNSVPGISYANCSGFTFDSGNTIGARCLVTSTLITPNASFVFAASDYLQAAAEL